MTDQAGPLVLVVEDDPQIRRFLRATLHACGYRLVEAGTAREGLALVSSQPVEVVLLDLGLPDLDGLEVVRRVREWATTPIIVISARGRDEEKVTALDAGADDYLTKPFSAPELLARIRVALRHAARVADTEAPAVFTIGELRIDVPAHVVTISEREIHLTPIEFKLLELLARHAGRVLTHRQLLENVWGRAHTENTNHLRVQMHGLRQKLEPEPARPRYLLTEPGVGYRLRAE